MFSKVANAILFFRLDIRMGLLYLTLCIGETRRGRQGTRGKAQCAPGTRCPRLSSPCPAGGQSSLSPGGALCPSLPRRRQL